MIFFGRYVTDVLGRVTRRVPRRQDQSAELELVPVLDRFALKSVFGAAFAAGIDFRGAGPVRELAGAADQIGVNVGLENVGNRHPSLSGQLEINFDVGPRID